MFISLCFFSFEIQVRFADEDLKVIKIIDYRVPYEILNFKVSVGLRDADLIVWMRWNEVLWIPSPSGWAPELCWSWILQRSSMPWIGKLGWCSRSCSWRTCSWSAPPQSPQETRSEWETLLQNWHNLYDANNTDVEIQRSVLFCCICQCTDSQQESTEAIYCWFHIIIFTKTNESAEQNIYTSFFDALWRCIQGCCLASSFLTFVK